MKTKAALCEHGWFLLGRGYNHGRGRQQKHGQGHSLRNSFSPPYPAAAHGYCPWEWQDPQVMLPGVRGQGNIIAPQSRYPALWLLGGEWVFPPRRIVPLRKEACVIPEKPENSRAFAKWKKCLLPKSEFLPPSLG